MRAGLAVLGSAVVILVAAAPATAGRHATAATAATRTLVVDGSQVAFRTVGPRRGRPLVLLTGLGGSMDTWSPLFVDELALPGRRVVLVDNEGVGRTRMRPGTLTVERMADGVAELILRLNVRRRPDVLAWSMGGMVAQSLAVRYPGLVRRLVLMATAPGDGRATLPRPQAGQALIGGDAARLLEVFFPPGAEESRARYLEELALRRGPLTPVPRDTMAAQFNASAAWLVGTDRTGRGIRRLRLPVLIGSGAKDVVLPAANQRHLAKRIPRARLVTYRDAGHMFFVQHEEDWLGRLDEFLGP
jgi:pimeloyl-ACP methyl ester carboxylesterase